MKLGTIILSLMITFCLQNTDAQRSIHYIKRSIDLGEISASAPPTKVKYDLVNKSIQNIQIEKITSSCACMVSQPNKEEIQPSDTSSIVVEFDPFGKSGYFHQIIFVHLLNKEEPDTLILTGSVKGVRNDLCKGFRYRQNNICFMQEKFTLRNFDSSKLRQDIIVIKNNSNQPCTLQAIGSSSAFSLDVYPKELQPMQEGELILTYSPQEKDRVPLHQKIELWQKMNGKEEFLLSIPIHIEK